MKKQIVSMMMFVICFMFVGTEAMAQGVVVYKKNGAIMKVPYEELDSIVTYDKNLTQGYEFVDLGLSVKWAKCNVGADFPEDYGDYYAWGELTTKSDYSWNTYKWCEISDTSMIKYSTVGINISLEFEDDVARVKWGRQWRMPTEKEIGELCDKCIWQWITINGVNGHLVTGPNGNFIFLPAAGLCDGTDFEYQGSIGYYWSSMLGYNETAGNTLYFRSNYKEYSLCWYRFYGFTVRPVTE